jgi:hypothetical protein
MTYNGPGDQPPYPPFPNQPYDYGPPHGYGPPQGYGYGPGYPPPRPQGTNGMAIAGFVLSFFCSILGIIFSVMGMNQTKRTGQSGYGLAVAGLVISIASIAFGIVYVAAIRKS